MCIYHQKLKPYFAKKGCKVLLHPTPEAIHVFNNKSHAKKIGLFHPALRATKPTSFKSNDPDLSSNVRQTVEPPSWSTTSSDQPSPSADRGCEHCRTWNGSESDGVTAIRSRGGPLLYAYNRTVGMGGGMGEQVELQ